MSKQRTAAPGTQGAPAKAAEAEYSRGTRETIESIVVAIILAFLFRTFIAEAFVIPTGSMAPTLMGKHKDVECSQCGYAYQAGASVEDSDGSRVVASTCPICRYTMQLDTANGNHASFTGDRILVSKFSYDLNEPQRWDVIVFKYPGNAKQNYIKRLIGLPNETVRIRHGDIFVKPDGKETFQIARKPEHKLLAMLQTVHDSRYVSPLLEKAGWPDRWRAARVDGGESRWTRDAQSRSYRADGNSDRMTWLRYQHVAPLYDDWIALLSGESIPDLSQLTGQLITDFYAYNAYATGSLGAQEAGTLGPDPDDPRRPNGLHWVGDLAVEARVEVRGEQGKLALKLVESGIHFECTIDVASGEAELSMRGGPGGFQGEEGKLVERPVAQTNVRGGGTYELRMANVDDEIWFWVNGRRVTFSSPTTYQGVAQPRPHWSPEDDGDLSPVGIGSEGLELNVEWLRVLRDKYYIATRGGATMDHHYPGYVTFLDVLQTFANPSTWATSELFEWDAAGPVEFPLGPDEFFPLGDNSPQSKDARLWESAPHVDRKLLTGKALLIYWPHAWNRPIPFLPNIQRMGFIR